MIFLTTTLINLPDNFTSDILNNTTTILSDLGGYITLIIGVILGLTIISILIRLIKG